MPEAREEILQRIRAAHAGQAAGENAIDRSYATLQIRTAEERLSLFLDRLRELGVTPQCCAAAEITGAIEGCLRFRSKTRLAVEENFPAAWLPAGFEYLTDRLLPYTELDQCDGSITGCAAAVASSGTILLDGGPGQGRRALSLLPDYHLCIVAERDIRDSLPEAMLLIDQSFRRPMTFITGPSATSDIEMTRIQGVHGPRTLEVIVVRP